MTEVPPPTRRTRRDVPASLPATPVEDVARAGAESRATPPVPGSAAVAAASFPPPAAPGGGRMPEADASIASARQDDPFVDDPERMPTAQLEMAAFGDHLVPYVPPQPPAPRSMAPWALTLAILALMASLITGWLLPLGVAAVIVSAMSLRRPRDSRRVAGWALALAVLSLTFSGGWLIWGFSQLAVV